MTKHLIIALLFFSFSLFAQVEPLDSLVEKPKKESIFDLFSKHEILEASLTTDLQRLEEVREGINYDKGIFAYKTMDGADSTIKVDVKLRGRFRLMNCDFPPLKLKFKKKKLKKKGVKKKYNKMKLVTHCMDDKATSKELIYREYLAYKLFNIIHDHSFRVQLVNMKYYQTDKKKVQAKGLGILVEDAKQVADRVGGKRTKELLLGEQPVEDFQEHIVALFQYMISNTDWDSNKTYKNVEMIHDEEEEEYLTVPYDFDFSGFVSAPYAKILRMYGQTSLRDRVFLGRATTVEELRPAINLYLEKKEEIISEITEFTLLSKDSRTDLETFILSFYDILEDEENLESVIFKKKE